MQEIYTKKRRETEKNLCELEKIIPLVFCHPTVAKDLLENLSQRDFIKVYKYVEFEKNSLSENAFTIEEEFNEKISELMLFINLHKELKKEYIKRFKKRNSISSSVSSTGNHVIN